MVPESRDSAGRPVRARASDASTIADLANMARTCELCRLHRDRTGVVVGSGPADADVVVVTEAPSWHDDRGGQLLSGLVGDSFDRVLEFAGLRRSDLYLTSVVKCRPPMSRSPFPDEVEACEGWLFREVSLIKPKIIVTLGTLSLRLVTGRQDRVSDVHGTMMHAQVQGHDVVVWPLYHPAAAMHVHSLTEEMYADARALGQLLRGARSDLAQQEATSVSSSNFKVPIGEFNQGDLGDATQLNLGV